MSQPMSPAIAELIERHGVLETPVRELLDAARKVRDVAALVFPERGLPLAARGDEYHQARQQVTAALEALEVESSRAAPAKASVEDTAQQLLVAVATLRAASHGFAPRRAAAQPERMAELVAAMRLAQEAFGRLEKEARKAHCGRLPWQLELACFVDPDEDERNLEIVGDALPGTAAARRAWGERCILTGTELYVDSRVSPVRRYRSLDSCYGLLSTEGYELVVRWRRALEGVRELAQRS